MSETISSPKKHYPSIDGIRAIAVLAVILFHLEIDLFSGGYVGVDIFFVISGYLITRNIWADISRGQFSLMSFYLARFRRLTPALLVTVFVSLLAGLLLYSPDALIRLSGSAIAGVLSLANIRFWQNSGYFDTDSVTKPLLHLWSLSVEEQFYLLWPLLIMFSFIYLKNIKQALLFMFGLVLASFVMTEHYIDSHPSSVFYLMPFRVFEFGIGGLYAVIEHTRKSAESNSDRITTSNALTLAGLILAISAVIIFDGLTPFPGVYSLLPCFGALLLIAAKDSSLSANLLANSFMVSIGRMSYSLYLVHWPVWVFASFWAVAGFNLFEKLVIFLIIVVLSQALYHFVEYKFRYAKKDGRNLLFFSLIGFSACFIIGISFFFRATDGVVARVPNLANQNKLYSEIKCEFPNGTKQVRACILGAKEQFKKTILLVGDSHSINLNPGLHKYGLEHKVRFNTYSVAGCAPLIDVEIYMPRARHPIENCSKFSEELKLLLSQDDIDTVMISARWAWYFEHAQYHDSQKPPKAFLQDKQTQARSALESRSTWQRSLNATLDFAQQNGKKVVLFAQYPLLHKGIGECNKSPDFLFNAEKVKQRCRVKIPYDVVMKRMAFTDDFIGSLNNANILSVIPSNYFCDDGTLTCTILTPKGLLYVDDNHISPLGSIFLLDSITTKLNAFL